MTALLFMGTALVGAFSPTPAGTSQEARFALTTIAFLLGVAAWFAPWDRWPRAATLVLVPPSLGMLASAILMGNYTATTTGVYYLLLFVWIGVAHRRGIALAVAPLAAAAYLIPMSVTGRWSVGFDSVWQIIGLGVVVGEGLSWMSTRLRRAEALEGARVWEMQMLLQAAERLARESDPGHVSQLIAGLGQQILRADATAVFLVEDRGTLVGVAGSQWPSAIHDLIIQIDDDVEIAASLRSGELSAFAADELPASLGPAGAFHTEVLLPLRGSSAIEGLFAAGYAHGEPRLDPFADHVARTFATQSALALERLHAVRSLLEDSLRDELTGLGNRHAANRAISVLRPTDAVVMIDIDHLKDLNDSEGHAAGDELLRAFARSATASLRDGDVAARLGGDEFLLILHGAGDRATATVERLAARWRQISPGTTFSAGIAARGDRDEDVVAEPTRPCTRRSAKAATGSRPTSKRSSCTPGRPDPRPVEVRLPRRPDRDDVVSEPLLRARHQPPHRRPIRAGCQLADDRDPEADVLGPQEARADVHGRELPRAVAGDGAPVTDRQPVWWLPAGHLHRLGERGDPEDPRLHGETDADALASLRDDVHAIGVEHPVGLPLPVGQHGPALVEGRGQDDLAFDVHLPSVWTPRANEPR